MAFNILSLDGGGIRGIVSSYVLREVERQIAEQTDRSLRDYFDLIAGTSTGSIVAAALALGRTSEDLIQVYIHEGETIFPYRTFRSLQRWPLILKYGLSAPKFSHSGLIEVLKKHLVGERGDLARLSDIDRPHLLITSYDTISHTPLIFKNWRHDRWYADLPLWQICVASSSAPTFFPAYKLTSGNAIYSTIDGGVAAHNPVACAIAAAIRLGHALDEINVFSIGTGDVAKPIPLEEAEGWGLSQWALRIPSVLMDAPSDIYDYVARQVLERADGGNYLRLQFELNNRDTGVNPLTGKAIDEAMDNASQDNLRNLLEATEAFLERGTIAFQGVELPVKDAITKFIAIHQ